MASFALRAVAALLLIGGSLLGGWTAWGATEAATESDQGTVTMEWFGHMFFRFTTPQGVVVLTTPNFDFGAPMSVGDVQRADIILIPNGHIDDRGRVLEVAPNTRASVLAPQLLGEWLVQQGLDRTSWCRLSQETRTTSMGCASGLSRTSTAKTSRPECPARW